MVYVVAPLGFALHRVVTDKCCTRDAAGKIFFEWFE
jgi:hypothetical protein